MRKIFTTYSFLLFIGSLLLSSLVNGCTANMYEENPTTPVAGSELLTISTRAGDVLSNETAIRTLRLVIFSEDDNRMVLNQLFLTKEAVDPVPNRELTYFAHIGDEYQIAILIPKGAIRIIMIANEITDLSGTYTLDGLRKTQVNYYDAYHQQDGALNIQISPTADSNIGSVPMYAESRKLYYPDWNGYGKVVPINLVRTLAKVSLQIDGIANNLDGTITIKSASIINATRHALWGDSIISYTGALTNTATQSFDIQATNGSGVSTSDKLVFYIPGHVVSAEDIASKRYTYIQINAQFTPTAGGEPVNSTYEIPIGNGVEAKGYDLKKMVASDLKVSRNKHYDVVAKVVTQGTLAVINVNVKVADWTDEEINGDINPPCLNVSSIDWMYDDGGTNRIYFWSNMDPKMIKLSPTVEITKKDKTVTMGTPIETVFDGLQFDASPPVPANFHFYEENGDESLYFHTNGYFDLKKSDTYSDSGDVVKIKFVAGKVTRSISVTLP